MAKKSYLICEQSKTKKGLLIPVKKRGEEVIIPNSKFRFFIDKDTGIITNYETGLIAGSDLTKLLNRIDTDDTVQKHIDFYGLIYDWPESGKQFYTVFEKYADDFKRIFGIDILNFRDTRLHCIGYDSFDVISFDEDFIKTRTDITGLSTMQATINKYGQEGADLIQKILDSEKSSFGNFIA
jgi:hypothetical protein